MSDEALRMTRAEQNHTAWTLMAPHFDAIRADYVAGLAAQAVKPMSDTVRQAIEKLAVAIKVLDEVKAQVSASIADGGLAQHDASRAAEMAKLSTEQGRWVKW